MVGIGVRSGGSTPTLGIPVDEYLKRTVEGRGDATAAPPPFGEQPTEAAKC